MSALRLTLLTSILLVISFTPALAFGLQLSSSCSESEIWYPPQTKFTVEGETIKSDVPDGWLYIGADSSSRVISPGGDGGSCSCDCTSASGSCSPSIFNGNCSCTAKDGCTACSLTSNFSGQTFTRGGYINKEVGVRFAKPNEAKDLPMVFDAMFELDWVLDTVNDFLTEAYGGIYSPELIQTMDGFVAPPGHQLVVLNVFGRAALVATPIVERGDEPVIIGGGGSCSCTDGSCTYDKTWIPTQGTIHYCEGDCAGTCTLTMNLINDTPWELSRSRF